MPSLDIKQLIAIVAGLIIIANHINYIRTILAHQTKPHFFSWLIWTITQGTAATAVIVGGGGAAGIAVFMAASLVCTIALLSLKYGTKNIRKRDITMFLTALLAILVWWQLHNPFIAIAIIALVDVIGYVLTLLKIKHDHTSEPLTYWSFDLVTYLLLVAALAEYNFLTSAYLITMCTMSVITVSFLFYQKFKKSHQINSN